MNIQKLSENEKDAAVREIVRKGVVTPMDKIRKIIHIRQMCTFHTLFFGVGDCLFLGLLIAFSLWLFLIRADSKVIVGLIFAVSPFAYIASYLLTTWKEHLLQLYEIKMACRYTIRQVSAFRMMYFSGANLLLNVSMLYLLVKFQLSGVIFWKTLGLSFSAVFLYGVVMLAFQLKGKPYLTMIFPPVLWGVVNTFVIAYYGEALEKMLLGLAGGLVVIIMIVLFFTYLIMLYGFMLSQMKGDESYVIG